jgi:hypothetical protein
MGEIRRGSAGSGVVGGKPLKKSQNPILLSGIKFFVGIWMKKATLIVAMLYMKVYNARHCWWQWMGRKNFNTTIDEATIESIERLAVNGKSKGAVVDEAIAALANPVDLVEVVGGWFQETWGRFDSLPEEVGEVLRMVVAELKSQRTQQPAPNGGFSPTSVPGVHRGLPPRESSADRAMRERRERQDRAAGLDSIDDPSIDRSDDFVSG